VNVTVRRPVMRYHGGKFRIAPRIIKHFPAHRIYVEPFGGAGSVLMRKERSFAEVYNDLDGEVVNVFRVLRDPAAAERLRVLLELTPWAREEFKLAYEPSDDPVEQARRTIARGFMGHGSTSIRINRTGFRAKNYKRNQTGAGDWRGFPEAVPSFVERLRGVTIECRPALDIIAQQDTAETLFFCDPPYVHAVRSALFHKGGSNDCCYRHELSDDDHRALIAQLRDVAGMVVLCGYRNAIYQELLGDWDLAELDATTDGGQPRTECLWLNAAASSGVGRFL
jgi:DNA adenine methylase